MKTRILTQSEKQHGVNRLHDAFIAAGFIPTYVESIPSESRFSFNDSVADASIEGVIASYTYAAPPAPVNIRTAWTNYKTAVNNATTVAQIKSALTNELGVLLKELLKTRDANLNG